MDLFFVSKETLNPKPSSWEWTLLWLSFPYFNFIGEPGDLDYSHGLLYWEIGILEFMDPIFDIKLTN